MTKTPGEKAWQKKYNAEPEQKKKRAANNAARREMIAEGKARVGDGKDVAHKKSLENGGSNARSNLTVQDRKTNRGWRKGSGSYNPDKK